MKIWKKLLIGLMSIACSMTPVTTHAISSLLSEEDLFFYGMNGIYFYMPGDNTKCSPGVINGNSVTIIGDSISFGAESEYASQIPNADFASKTYNDITYELVQVSKHFSTDAGDNYSGMTIADEIQKQGDMRPYLVFALGTNDPGAVTDSSIEALMDLVGTNHKVVLVTNYAVDDQLDYSVNNAAIRSAGEKYSNVAVADWAEAVKSNPNAYIGDGYVHPNAGGSKLFVQLVKEALNSLAGGTGGISTGGNKNYAGEQVWTDVEMQAIEKNAPIYQEAASKYDFPWEFLAVFHSLESNLGRWNPPAQWDSSKSEGVYQLHSWAKSGRINLVPKAEISEEEFREQTFYAAEFISETFKGADWDDPNQIKSAIFQFNGKAETYINKALNMGFTEEEAWNGEGSPYVMNKYDAQRDLASSDMSPYWPGRFVNDGVYDPTAVQSGFGGFVKYEALVGSSYCSSTGGTIADVAIELSWDRSEGHAKDDPKPEYVEAMKATGTWDAALAINLPVMGASCDQFVSTVMRYSGADPDFPAFWPPDQEDYMQNHPDMYEKIEANYNVENLQPGDIFVTGQQCGVNEDGTTKWCNHIFLYVGEIDGQPSSAEASYNSRTGEHFPGVVWTMGQGMDYSIYRRINY